MCQLEIMATSISDSEECSDEYDQLLYQASQQYEEEAEQLLEERYQHMQEDDFLFDRLMPKGVCEVSLHKSEPHLEEHYHEIKEDGLLYDRPLMKGGATTTKERFSNPVTEEDILKNIVGSIPVSTRKTTEWSVKTWREWAENRQSKCPTEVVPELEIITNEQLNHWLSRFVIEVRNQQGDYYRGGTLYSLCSGIQRFVQEKRTGSARNDPVDIYKDSTFSFFRSSFDSILKQLHHKGIGTKTKQAEVISENVEDRLWNEGSLGDDTPQKLLDSLIFCFGLNLALRSGKEHRQLRPDMLELIETLDSISYLLYTESGSKNRSGGLQDRKVMNKSVKIFPNKENPARCII